MWGYPTPGSGTCFLGVTPGFSPIPVDVPKGQDPFTVALFWDRKWLTLHKVDTQASTSREIRVQQLQAHCRSPDSLFAPCFQPLFNISLKSSFAIRPGINVHEFKSMVDCMLVLLREAHHRVTVCPLRENTCSQSTDATVWEISIFAASSRS